MTFYGIYTFFFFEIWENMGIVCPKYGKFSSKIWEFYRNRIFLENMVYHLSIILDWSTRPYRYQTRQQRANDHNHQLEKGWKKPNSVLYKILLYKDIIIYYMHLNEKCLYIFLGHHSNFLIFDDTRCEVLGILWQIAKFYNIYDTRWNFMRFYEIVQKFMIHNFFMRSTIPAHTWRHNITWQPICDVITSRDNPFVTS